MRLVFVLARPILEDTLVGEMKFPPHNIPSEVQPNMWIETTQVVPPTDSVVHPNLIRLVRGIRNKSTRELNEEVSLCETSMERQVIEPKGLISFGRRISGYHGEIVDPDQSNKTVICTYGTCPRLFVGLHHRSTNRYLIRPFTLTELAQIQGLSISRSSNRHHHTNR